MNIHKQAVVVHSGGMDSSICLAYAIKEYGANEVLSLSFRYGQRHSDELVQAATICRAWHVDHVELNIDCLQAITTNALMNHEVLIEHPEGEVPNTLVAGRNGLMARLAGIHAESLGAHDIYMGIIEVETANSGYRDCTRDYMNKMQELLRIDFADPEFNIITPVVYMTKLETMELARDLGVLDYLLEHSISCYQGIMECGCQECPACHLRNEGIRQFMQKYPDYQLPYEL